MDPYSILQHWKKQPYMKTNYDNIHAHYADHKYIRMKPKSQITLTPGLIFMIIKHPKQWVQQNFKLENEVTLHNDTVNILYFILKDSLLSNEDKNEKLHVKNGVPKDDDQWLN
jgi:hypothetical protein|tara:strand:+ start:3374 stop:3712 length:339 start_codon:yes stop_codon:yes gene_type:complete